MGKLLKLTGYLPLENFTDEEIDEKATCGIRDDVADDLIAEYLEDLDDVTLELVESDEE